jgi:mono/diheme cytochrome c family protein
MRDRRDCGTERVAQQRCPSPCAARPGSALRETRYRGWTARVTGPFRGKGLFRSGRPRSAAPLSAGTALLCALPVAALAFGCRQDMHDQPKYEPYEKSEFFADGRAMRPPVEGTVARGQLRDDTRLHAGKEGAAFVAAIPIPVDEKLVRRGQERFGIYCTPCHGERGMGNGMIVQRGYRTPASFHEDRLRAQPDGYYFDVMTNGFGVMPDYASQVTVKDRWAIVAYIRALQVSQNATLDDVPPAERSRLAGAGMPAAPTPAPPAGHP